MEGGAQTALTLVYEDGDGQTWLVYEQPAKMFEGLDVPQDAEYLAKMSEALKTLTGKAAAQ